MSLVFRDLDINNRGLLGWSNFCAILRNSKQQLPCWHFGCIEALGIGEIGWGKFEYDGVNTIFFQGLVRIGTLFFSRVCIFYPVPTHYKMRWRRSKTIQNGVRVAAFLSMHLFIFMYIIYLRRYHFLNIFLIETIEASFCFSQWKATNTLIGRKIFKKFD